MLEHFVQQAMTRARIRPDKSKGQNFLVSDNVLAKLITASALDGSEYVIEVGPGLGTLSSSIASRCEKLFAYEIDEKLVRYLRNWVVPEFPNITLEDVAFNGFQLMLIAEKAEADGRPLKIITNLPYQISGAFIHSLVDYSERIERTVVILQREMAQRLVAQPSDTNFSSFSLYVQSFLDINWICEVPPSSFYPPPKVKSAVIRLTPKDPAKLPKPVDRGLYFKLVEGVFRNRRKQISNSLKMVFPWLSGEASQEALKQADIDSASRPQDMSMAEYIRLSDVLCGMEQPEGD